MTRPGLDPAERAERMIRNDPTSALLLAYALMGQMHSAPFPRLRVVTVHDDGETYTGLRCPWCGDLVQDSAEELVAVDWGTWETASIFIDPVLRLHSMQYDHAPQMETLHYKHDGCGKPVSLPHDWTEE